VAFPSTNQAGISASGDGLIKDMWPGMGLMPALMLLQLSVHQVIATNGR
jgi:hypothetical protein